MTSNTTLSLTPTPADVAAHVRPTVPLPADAVKAMVRLETAFAPAVAAQRSVERTVAGLRNGESAVINGTTVTAVSLAVAEAVTRYETASVCAVQLAARAESGGLSDLDADSLAHAEDVMAGAKAVLAEAGMLHLLGGAS